MFRLNGLRYHSVLWNPGVDTSLPRLLSASFHSRCPVWSDAIHDIKRCCLRWACRCLKVVPGCEVRQGAVLFCCAWGVSFCWWTPWDSSDDRTYASSLDQVCNLLWLVSPHLSANSSGQPGWYTPTDGSVQLLPCLRDIEHNGGVHSLITRRLLFTKQTIETSTAVGTVHPCK